MEFDWTRAVERNLNDLLRIVARLFFMAGIRTGRSLVFLPRSLRSRILAVLRPAEFAARRLVVMAACKLVTVVTRRAEARGRRSPAIPDPDCEGDEAPPATLGLDPRDHSLKAAPAPEPKNSALTIILRDDDPDEGKRPAGPGDDGKRGQPDATPSDAELLDLWRDRPSFALFDPWKRYAPLSLRRDRAGRPLRPRLPRIR